MKLQQLQQNLLLKLQQQLAGKSIKEKIKVLQKYNNQQPNNQQIEN